MMFTTKFFTGTFLPKVSKLRGHENQIKSGGEMHALRKTHSKHSKTTKLKFGLACFIVGRIGVEVRGSEAQQKQSFVVHFFISDQ